MDGGEVLKSLSLCIPSTAITYELLKTVNDFYLASPSGSQVVIVLDGPNNSPMLELLNTQGDDFSLTVLESRQGPAHARNHAAKMAKGEVLIFADSDVIVPTSVFLALENVVAGHVKVPAILPSPLTLPFGLNPAGFLTKSMSFFSDFSLAPKIVDGKTLAVSACFSISKVDFLAIQGFDESFKFPAGEDWDFFTRLHNAGIEVEFDNSIRAFHNNPKTHLGVARRSFRYARYGALASESTALTDRIASPEGPVKLSAIAHLPSIFFTGIMKILCSRLSVGDDKLAATARRLHAYQTDKLSFLQSKKTGFTNVPIWLKKLNRVALSLLDSLLHFPVSNPWDTVLIVREEMTLKDKKRYRVLVMIWTVAYMLGYIVRERMAKKSIPPKAPEQEVKIHNYKIPYKP